MAQTSNPERKVPTRRISFEESFKDVPKHFADDGDLILSHIAASLSSVFPDGEDFFVRSVRNFRDQVTDPALKRQVAGFIGQEAVHGREHRALNDHLDKLGYPTKRFERITKKGLEIRERILSPKSNLAATAALEHFTATLAEVILREDRARDEFVSPEVRTLFSWHALEETEHKSVAFDVFQHVCGDQRVRVWTMYGIHVGFLLGMVLQVGLSILLDGDARRRPLKTLRSLRGLRTHVFFQRDVQRRLRDYHRADFHPDDHDTVELLDHWRQELTLQAA